MTLHPTTRRRKDRYTFADHCPHCGKILGARDHFGYDWTGERHVNIFGKCRGCGLEYRIVRSWEGIRQEHELVTSRCLIIDGAWESLLKRVRDCDA